jgi:hypothetical protein
MPALVGTLSFAKALQTAEDSWGEVPPDYTKKKRSRQVFTLYIRRM